LQVEDIPLH